MREHVGGWSAYRDHAAAQRSAPAPARAAGSQPSPRARHRGPSASALRRERERVERRIGELEARRDVLTAAVQAAGADHEAAWAAARDLEAVRGELDDAETRWLELETT